MTINPIVAPLGSHPGDPWAGVWLAEDVEAIHQGVTSGSWIDTTLGGVGAGLDTLAAVSDPLGTLMQYGLSWLMEHIRPLSEALDWLAGDPAQIASHSQTWRNVASSLRSDVSTFGQGAATGVSGWQGTAATAYQMWASHQQTLLGGLASAADTMASISDGVAYLIAGVRVMVRDAIATVVSRAIDYAGEEFFSFGLATPWVIEQVSTLVASWSARIGRWITALRDSVGRLTSMMGRLGEIIEALKKLLRDDRGSISSDPMKHSPEPETNGATAAQRREFTGADLTVVTDHLSKLDPFGANDAMLQRIGSALESGSPLTEAQTNFMRHELRESELMNSGMSYEDAHAAALETHPPGRNYDPDLIDQYPEFGPWWRKMNGLGPR